MNVPDTAVILINIGTPDSPSVGDVRRYLSEFLNDPRVMDIPRLLRKILVNMVIIPFRSSRSAKLYRILWTDNGSPLLYYGKRVRDRLEEISGDDFRIFLAMRYGNPGLDTVLEEIKTSGYRKIIAIPLYPQYASSTTGTSHSAIMDKDRKWEVIPEISFISQFYDNPGFIDAFTKRIRSSNYRDYDHVVFSYHGLPVRHINRGHPSLNAGDCVCEDHMPDHGAYCYKATCYETTRLLAARLKLNSGDYSTAFQSRLYGKWLQPFTDELLLQKAREGAGKILIAAPSFVADCLETTVELGIEYKKLFLSSGGRQLDYVESLNDMHEWVDTLKEMFSNPGRMKI